METGNRISKRIIILTASGIFAKKGYRASTLEDVANELGVTKPALYYYVKNKHQILWSIFEEILDIYLRSAMAILEKDLDPKEKLHRLIESHAHAVLDNRYLTTIFVHERAELTDEELKLLKTKIRAYELIFVEVYREGIKRGVFIDLNPFPVIKGIFGMINGLYQWYDERGAISKKEIIDIYTQILEEGYVNLVKVPR
ncbi:TetR family transcriptional regulator [Ammoniphilus sp. 3BR4]|uniref:TetR family transcriptional regulator n=1 Tax=Ammoniphilus sp. 3BR4 TaxID=3158265 RepID=UPI0034656743